MPEPLQIENLPPSLVDAPNPAAMPTQISGKPRSRSVGGAILPLCILVAAGIVGFAWYHRLQSDRLLLPGLKVQGVAVGGLDRDQAKSKLQELATHYLAQPITLTFRNHHY